MASSTFGVGWPTCDRTNIVTLVRSDGLRIPLHRDVVDLVQILMDLTEAVGYNIVPEWTWGYACRPIAGTTRPSNHSWGTAVDINAPTNPRRADRRFVSDIPARIVNLWKDQNFRWGGEYSWPDPMHFEFMGTAEEARRRAVDLRRFLAANGGKTPGAAPFKPPTYPGTVKLGSRGNAVKVWQQRLQKVVDANLKVDGIFGQATHHVVVFFQRRHGLVPDGIAGPRTWHVLWFGTS